MGVVITLDTEKKTLRDRYGNSETYEICVKNQEIALEAGSDINRVAAQLQELEESYNEMITLIPTFGTNYDSLGRNTKVNIEAIQCTTSDIASSLEGISATITDDAIKVDGEKTEEDKVAAQKRLDIKTDRSRAKAKQEQLLAESEESLN